MIPSRDKHPAGTRQNIYIYILYKWLPKLFTTPFTNTIQVQNVKNYTSITHAKISARGQAEFFLMIFFRKNANSENLSNP